MLSSGGGSSKTSSVFLLGRVRAVDNSTLISTDLTSYFVASCLFLNVGGVPWLVEAVAAGAGGGEEIFLLKGGRRPRAGGNVSIFHVHGSGIHRRCSPLSSPKMLLGRSS